VIASSPVSPGQVYALHNDDDQGGSNDIALAQVDLSTGALVQDLPVPGTGGYEVQSSPVLTEPDAGGDASLFFVASDGVNTRSSSGSTSTTCKSAVPASRTPPARPR
jgi:hypothetical protein